MSLTITLDNWERVERAFQLAPSIVQEEMSRFMHGAVTHLQSEVMDRTPVGASGGAAGLRGSISGTVASVAGTILGVVGTPSPYAIPVELGTRPHFPPVQALEDWVRAKLDVGEADVHRVAFLIARKIGRVGTEGAHMFRDAFNANTNQVQSQFDATVARIEMRIFANP